MKRKRRKYDKEAKEVCQGSEGSMTRKRRKEGSEVKEGRKKGKGRKIGRTEGRNEGAFKLVVVGHAVECGTVAFAG
jgi:hypothetical protein